MKRVVFAQPQFRSSGWNVLPIFRYQPGTVDKQIWIIGTDTRSMAVTAAIFKILIFTFKIFPLVEITLNTAE